MAEAKQYHFTVEELMFLKIRHDVIKQNKVINSDLEFVIEQFIFQNVLARLGETNENKKIVYDVVKSTITIEEKEPEMTDTEAEVLAEAAPEIEEDTTEEPEAEKAEPSMESTATSTADQK